MLRKLFEDIRQAFIRPIQEGWLPECDGHQIYYHVYGNPKGIPVISFHGGPGSNSKKGHTFSWPLKKYQVILFDQRGCGKSLAKVPLYKNTIQDTMKDAKRLLDHLGIQKKVISAGGSYGATCATFFAITYPDKVRELVVNSVFTGCKKDYEKMAPTTEIFYPDAYDTFLGLSGGEPIDDYFYDLLMSDNPTDYTKVLRYYGAFERQLGDKEVSFPPLEEVTEKDLRRFRVFMHYQKNGMFLKEGELIERAKKITVPTRIYQNRLDFCCPPYQAYALHKAIQGSKFFMIPAMGHGGLELRKKMHQDNLK